MVFSQDHKTCAIESYFRNGERIDGNWSYNTQACLKEFPDQFPGLAFLVADFYSMLRNSVQLFRETGSVNRRKSTGHTTPETIDYLRQFFGDRIISLRCAPEFLLRSPDLTILDYFVFPYLKNRIFKNPVQTLEQLLQLRITEQSALITPLMLINAS